MTQRDETTHSRGRARRTLAFAAALIALGGCEQREPQPQAVQEPPPVVQTGPQWQALGDAWVLPAASLMDDEALADAVEKARQTMNEARTRWSQDDAAAQQRWAVKWAAPLEAGGVEYLWVRPVHWSPFRVEGVLLNDPVQPLLCGARRGETVGFPDEELCDWLHLPRNGSGAPAEGGFTNDALLGAPGES